MDAYNLKKGISYMKNIKEIIKLLRETSGTNDKINILKINSNNELLKKILEYTYNPYKKYGVSEKILNTISSSRMSSKSIFELLDILSSNNINDNLREEIGAFKNANIEDWDLYEKMILKDLRCNISSKTINKVWPGLIPVFSVMRADNYEDNKRKINGDVIVSSKIDGFKCIVIKNGDSVKLYSRNGILYEGLEEVENAILSIEKESFVIDGELYAIGDFKNNELGYKATSKIARKKGVKSGLKLIAYDYLEVEEFYNGKSKEDTKTRKDNLKKLLSNNKSEFIEYLEPLYIGNDLELVDKIGLEEIKKGEEGIIVSLSNAKWEAKRSKGCLKIKLQTQGDLLVKSVYEGTGKYKGMLGGVNCEFLYKGNICKVDVGSGWKDSDRKILFDNPENIVGKIITVDFRGITQDENNNDSLRFPTVIGYPECVRFDKDGIEDTNIDL